MNIEEMKKRKIELGYSNEQVSRLSGVPLGTVQKLFAGITKSPRYATLQALEQIFRSSSPPDSDASRLRETELAYEAKKQGAYTLRDYYAMPEDRRVELIDGVIYDMTAPNFRHQLLLSELFWEIKNYIRTRGGACIATLSPTDVQLDCDDKTMLQPDLLVLCDLDKYRDFGVFGAPDLVMEVLSPSTRKKDTGLKVTKYGDAGVREYWIIDPEQEKILVYDFTGEIYPVIYGYADKVPVGIFDGNCVVDFKEIAEHLYPDRN